jgi:hypothetical protein
MRLPQCRVDRAAQPSERFELLAAGEPLEQAQVSRQVAEHSPRGNSVAAAVETEQKRMAARRPDQVEEEADRRALARAVRAEEPEDFAVLDAQVELGQRANTPPIRLRQSNGFDRGFVCAHARVVCRVG